MRRPSIQVERVHRLVEPAPYEVPVVIQPAPIRLPPRVRQEQQAALIEAHAQAKVARSAGRWIKARVRDAGDRLKHAVATADAAALRSEATEVALLLDAVAALPRQCDPAADPEGTRALMRERVEQERAQVERWSAIDPEASNEWPVVAEVKP